MLCATAKQSSFCRLSRARWASRTKFSLALSSRSGPTAKAPGAGNRTRNLSTFSRARALVPRVVHTAREFMCERERKRASLSRRGRARSRLRDDGAEEPLVARAAAAPCCTHAVQTVCVCDVFFLKRQAPTAEGEVVARDGSPEFRAAAATVESPLKRAERDADTMPPTVCWNAHSARVRESRTVLSKVPTRRRRREFQG